MYCFESNVFSRCERSRFSGGKQMQVGRSSVVIAGYDAIHWQLEVVIHVHDDLGEVVRVPDELVGGSCALDFICYGTIDAAEQVLSRKRKIHLFMHDRCSDAVNGTVDLAYAQLFAMWIKDILGQALNAVEGADPGVVAEFQQRSIVQHI